MSPFLFGVKLLLADRIQVIPDLASYALQRLGAVVDWLTGDDDEVHAAVVALTDQIHALEALNRRPLRLRERRAPMFTAERVPHL